MRELAGGARGYTVLELLIVMMITGIVLSISIPRGRLMLDRLSVHAAASDVMSVLNTARTLARAGRSPVAVDIDSANGVLRVRRGTDVLLARDVGQAHGVSVGRTRDSLTYDPRGLGRGAANLSVIIRRRAAAETVVVSRLGRVR
jgi:prepilin-type N-terminal cleavage/methylation domain-containing protein